jgi:hypothetical protein
MSTDSQHVACPTSERAGSSIGSIAAAAAKGTLLWIAKFFAFLGGVTAFSVGIALISTMTIGAAIAFLVITGLIVSTPHSNHDYFSRPQ